VGEMFDIMTAAGGGRARLAQSSPYWIGNGRLVYFTPIYNPTKVTIDITSVVSVVPGDYNGNGIVDAADYTVWRDHLGQTYALLNRDPGGTGPISATDYNFWLSHFGDTGSGAGAASAGVPEPSTILLMRWRDGMHRSVGSAANKMRCVTPAA